MKIVHFQNGERIIRAGEMEKRMFIVLEGSVIITLLAENRQDKVEVARLGVNDFFGEISFFTNQPRSATVTADSDVRLAEISDIRHLDAFLIKNPAFAAKMVRILAARLAKTDEYLVSKVKELERLQILTNRFSR